MHTVLTEQAIKLGDRPALQFDERTLSYRELDELANALAGALAHRGVRQGDFVALMISNRAEFAISYFALARLGAVAVPITIALKSEGLAYIFHQTEASTAIIEASLLPRVEVALQEKNYLRQIIIVGSEGEHTTLAASERFETLVDERRPVASPEIQPGDLWAIMYTSGTTGPSKGVMLPHQFLASQTAAIVADFEYNEETVGYTFMPLFHMNAVAITMMPAIFTGSRCVIRANFPREHLLDDIRATGATHTVLAPFIIRGLLATPPQSDDRDNPLKVVFGMSLTPAEWQAFEERFAVQYMTCYGPTESGLVCQATRGKLGSTGRLGGRYEVQIVDELDRPVPPGTIGEIVSRPRRPFEVMLGYYKMPEATARAFRNLWFHTGDLGWVDADGYLYFSDRLKDSIKRRGENVSSMEVEDVISRFPGVQDVAVVGYRHPSGSDEEVRAFIVSKREAAVDPTALIQHCSAHLAYFMVPRYLDFRSELPRNAVGKVEKVKLRGIPLDEATFDLKKTTIVLER
ncbi:MAG TPA: AMP-binding protein, partial [Ktedonobacterales bacterium]|nr:AMP-binding protein [Ktedonobacterales bacterium]